MPASEAQRKAARTYIAQLDEVKLRMAKGKKERWKEAAEAEGISLNQLIITAVEKYINEKSPA